MSGGNWRAVTTRGGGPTALTTFDGGFAIGAERGAPGVVFEIAMPGAGACAAAARLRSRSGLIIAPSLAAAAAEKRAARNVQHPTGIRIRRSRAGPRCLPIASAITQLR